MSTRAINNTWTWLGMRMVALPAKIYKGRINRQHAQTNKCNQGPQPIYSQAKYRPQNLLNLEKCVCKRHTDHTEAIPKGSNNDHTQPRASLKKIAEPYAQSQSQLTTTLQKMQQ